MQGGSNEVRFCNDAVRSGLVRGAFSQAPRAILAHIEEMMTTSDGEVVYAKGYQVDTYLITPRTGSFSGIVVKIVPDANARLVKSVVQEATILYQIGINTGTNICVWPTMLAFYQYGNAHVLVTLKIAGNIATSVRLSRHAVIAVAQVICETQRRLATLPYGRQMLSDSSQASNAYYASTIVRWLEKYAKVTIDQRSLSFFDEIEMQRIVTPAIVSDRSPANFIVMNNRGVGCFDFGLMLVGIPQEDWSWFIDDPRLKTSLPRSLLIDIFGAECGNDTREVQERLYHVAAVFVCIKQYFLMREAGKHYMADHYLKRASASADILPFADAKKLVHTISNPPM